MSDESPESARAEERVFDLWLAHREADETGGPSPERIRTPAWAPPVVTPHADPADHAEPSAAVAVTPVHTTAFVEAIVPPAPAEAPAAAAEPVEPVETVVEPADATPVEGIADDVEEAAAAEVVDPSPTQDLPVAEVAPEIATPAEPADDAPVRMTFAPRTKARAAVGIGTLMAAGAAVIGTYVEQDTASIGIAVTLWVLTAIIWAVHSGTSVTRMSVRGGQLQVLQHGVRTTIDLTSSYTPVEVHGRPGRGWRVVFRRRDMSEFVIDQSMVDPNEFMRVLRYYRPGIDQPA